MSLPKREGGLGFRDLHQFNKALLAKQAWRILSNPTSLLARLYRGRYHAHTPFLQALTGTQASYGWQSLQVGKALLQQGLRVRLGDGTNTKVWSDPWLPTLPPRPASGPVIDSRMTVSDLWMENQRDWDPVMFEGVLNPADQQLARSLYLSKCATMDTYEWAYTDDAKYSVRSGYWVATHITTSEEDDIQPPLGDVDLKKEIWKLKIAPKIQHFLWRCISGALASATQLRTRDIPANPVCQRCCLADESIDHILFDCPYAMAVWRCTNFSFGFMQGQTDTLEDKIWLLIRLYKNQALTSMQRLLPLWMLWRLWKSRNDFLFQKKNRDPYYDAQKALSEVLEWLDINPLFNDDSAGTIGFVNRMTSRNSQWSPPPNGWLKCNFDSSFLRGRSFTGSGWIVRDCRGQLIIFGCARLQNSYSPLQAEALGFLHALQSVWALGFRHVWFESDNLELTNLINSCRDNIGIGSLLFDIRHWMAKLPDSSLGHVNREKNTAADKLAKHASTMVYDYKTFNVPSIWLENLLYPPFTE